MRILSLWLMPYDIFNKYAKKLFTNRACKKEHFKNTMRATQLNTEKRKKTHNVQDVLTCLSDC